MPTLEITTKLGCSLACTFCPQGNLVKAYPKDAPRLLTFDKFMEVLAKVPRHVRIDFSGMAEPWLNPDATKMVIAAFNDGRKVAIYSTLQGMPAADARLLVARYADKIGAATPWVIHLPDDEGNMPGWHFTQDYRETLSVFVEFKRSHPELNLQFMTMSPTGGVAKELLETFPYKLYPFLGITRDDNVDRERVKDSPLEQEVFHRTAVVCKSTPFFDHNVMLPNGDVAICCMDYSLEATIGNLFEGDYRTLFQSPAMNDVRFRAMSPADDPSFICKRCSNATQVVHDRGDSWKLEEQTLWSPDHKQVRPPNLIKRLLNGFGALR